MSLFDRFRTKPGKTSEWKRRQEQAEEDEYVVATLVPRNVPNTAELKQRRREEELRRKYCDPSGKAGM